MEILFNTLCIRLIALKRYQLRMGVTNLLMPDSLFSLFFRSIKTYGRCKRSSLAAVIHVKYERDLNEITHYYVTS